MDETRRRADRRLAEAIESRGARDPRDYYRERLRELRERDRSAYDRAVEYYRETLLPSVAEEGTDPLAAWTEYGRTLAELWAAGRTVTVGPTGVAGPYEAPPPDDALILHLPESRREKALLVALPAEPTRAQRAAYDLLVAGRNRLPA